VFKAEFPGSPFMPSHKFSLMGTRPTFARKGRPCSSYVEESGHEMTLAVDSRRGNGVGSRREGLDIALSVSLRVLSKAEPLSLASCANISLSGRSETLSKVAGGLVHSSRLTVILSWRQALVLGISPCHGRATTEGSMAGRPHGRDIPPQLQRKASGNFAVHPCYEATTRL
jgi:hypothetical protein